MFQPDQVVCVFCVLLTIVIQCHSSSRYRFVHTQSKCNSGCSVCDPPYVYYQCLLETAASNGCRRCYSPNLSSYSFVRLEPQIPNSTYSFSYSFSSCPNAQFPMICGAIPMSSRCISTVKHEYEVYAPDVCGGILAPEIPGFFTPDFASVSFPMPPTCPKTWWESNGDTIITPVTYTGTTDFTIELQAFIQLRSLSGTFTLVGDMVNSGLGIRIEAGQWYAVAFFGTTFIRTPNVQASSKMTWLALVKQATNISLFVDGIYRGSASSNDTFIPSTYPLVIGGEPSSTGGVEFLLDGLYSQIRFSNISRYNGNYTISDLVVDEFTLAFYPSPITTESVSGILVNISQTSRWVVENYTHPECQIFPSCGLGEYEISSPVSHFELLPSFCRPCKIHTYNPVPDGICLPCPNGSYAFSPGSAICTTYDPPLLPVTVKYGACTKSGTATYNTLGLCAYNCYSCGGVAQCCCPFNRICTPEENPDENHTLWTKPVEIIQRDNIEYTFVWNGSQYVDPFGEPLPVWIIFGGDVDNTSESNITKMNTTKTSFSSSLHLSFVCIGWALAFFFSLMVTEKHNH